MGYRTLLLHVDTTAACAARLALAVSIARRWGGHLTGVYCAAAELDEAAGGDGASPWLADARRAEALFRTALDGSGLSAEWVRPLRGRTYEIVRNARFADLVVIGQPDPDDARTHAPAAHPERVVLSVGRPVLMVPYTGAAAQVPEQVLVGWDASTPAVRALHDAMPLLLAARRVSILSVNPPDLDGPSGNIGERIAANLRRHGIRVRADRTFAERGFEIADVLLDWAAENGDQLLVIGAPATRRLGARVMDGPARKLVQRMNLPVLMSH